jgi:predicted DCC family thiol-disulfide oxidoreductase YuxK
VILPSAAAMHLGIYWTMSVGFYRQIATYAVFIPWAQGLQALARGAGWTVAPAARPEILYDGKCPLCRRSMALLRWADWFDRLRYTDVEADWPRVSREHPGLSKEACLRDMHVLLPDPSTGSGQGGCVRAGFFAYRTILRHTPLLWPLWLLTILPLASVVGPRVYAFVASRRPRRTPCTDAVCALPHAHGGSREHRPWLAWVLAGIVALGLWARAERLGQPSFDIDEYLHVFAAQSLNETGRPTLPSGEAYTRALPFTWLVAQGFQRFGVSETSARLPGLGLDLCSILLLFVMARRWFGTGPALVAAGALAFAPWWIQAAKTARMYPLLHFLYLIAGWAGWQALEGARGLPRAGWAAVALAAVTLAVRTHALASVLAVALGVFVVGMALTTRARRYLVVAAVGLAAAGVALSVGLLDLGRLWDKVNSAPVWAQGSRYAWGYYLRDWWPAYPLWVVLYLPALRGVWKRSRALAWFLVCMGLLPFALHSVVFDAKRLRYVTYLLPWLVVVVAGPVAGWMRGLWRLRLGWRVALGTLSVLAIGHSWLWQAPQGSAQFPSPPWRSAYAWLRPQLQARDALITSMPLATQYYLGRPASYVTNNVHLQGVLPTRAGTEDGLRLDGYAGRPMITTLEELERVVAAHPRGWVLIDQRRLQTQTMTQPMLAYLQTQCEAITSHPAAGGVNPVRIYHWDRQVPVREARRAEEVGG